MSLTYDEYAAELGLTMEVLDAPNRPGWMEGSSHYAVTITNPANDQELSVPFSAGPALKDEPSIGDVLMAVALDAASYEDSDDWLGMAEDLGADLDTPESRRKAKRDYEACRSEAVDLRRLLGTKEYERLVWSGEVTE